ncbi:MAG: hypothetical protein RLZZ338_4649 [Cyanobacteriota bacterium]|jgi:LuxR family glucitol operon transcriptional activator
MPRATYGNQVRSRVKHLLSTILSYANDELENSEQLRDRVEVYWQSETQLVVRTKLRNLEELTLKTAEKLTKEQIREALNRLQDLGILQDNRTTPKGSEIWHFTLKLWSKKIDINLCECDRVWQFHHSIPSVSPQSPPETEYERDRLRLPYCNLPSPTYPEFIGRKTEIKQLLKFISLNYRTPIITVDGIGGVGKTALVLEAAYQCWETKNNKINSSEIPCFDAIIFTSAKQNYLLPSGIVPRQEIHNTLSHIFRAIALTLDEPKITQADTEEQISLVYESLSRQRTLLIIDNMETMPLEVQDEVLGFLCDLPSTTKAVITTRQRRLAYAAIRLDSLSEIDSYQLIAQQADNKSITLNPHECQAIYQHFGGIPVALIYAIGQLARGYSLERILDKSQPLPDDIAYFCFDNSVAPIREKPAHKLLKSLAIFTDAPVKDALIEVAQLRTIPQSIIDDSLAELYQLSLVRPQAGRYEMLSLTREYAKTELGKDLEFEKNARKRWVQWYIDFGKEYGHKDWGEWHLQCDRLEAEWGNLVAVLYWCAEAEKYDNVKTLWQCLNDYAYFYGYWEERNFWLDWLIQAGERQGDWAGLTETLKNKGFILTRQGTPENLSLASEVLTRAWELRNYADLKTQRAIASHITKLRLCQNRVDEAPEWIEISKQIVNAPNYQEKWQKRDGISCIYTEAQIYYYQQEWEKAKEKLEEVIKQTEEIGWMRLMNYGQNWLADVAIEQGDLEKAEKLLKMGLPVAQRNKDRRRIACYQASFAQWEKKRGNLIASQEWVTLAKEGFEHLGMKQELEKINQNFQCLK